MLARELEILDRLDRLGRGLRNDARMGISMKTVQNNISGVVLELGAVDRG